MIPYHERPLVYLAAPYTTHPVHCTHQVVQRASVMQQTGIVTCVVPHLNLLWDIVLPQSSDYWLTHDLALLARSDALFRLPGASIGADREVEFATDSGIPVFHEESKLLEWAATALMDD